MLERQQSVNAQFPATGIFDGLKFDEDSKLREEGNKRARRDVPRIRTGLAREVIPTLSEKCYLRRTAPSYRSSVLIYMW